MASCECRVTARDHDTVRVVGREFVRNASPDHAIASPGLTLQVEAHLLRHWQRRWIIITRHPKSDNNVL